MQEMLKSYMTEFTSLSEQEQQEIAETLVIKEFPKGAHLIKQGDKNTLKCYFTLKGCIRQYYVDAAGNEVTTNFYTEEQAIITSHSQNLGQVSKYSFACLEDCTLVIGSLANEKLMYHKYSQLETMARKMMEIYFKEAQDEFSELFQAAPEERYKTILEKRPHLISRVPQHQLASYLGITPESLSRIKKRMKAEQIEN